MERFDSFRYLYPPRPEVAIPAPAIGRYDTGEYIAQPKLNGTCTVLFLDGKVRAEVYNRHREEQSNCRMGVQELGCLHRGQGWMVLVGEYMNKSKAGGDGLPFNHKLVLFDIMVYEGQLLTGTAFEERLSLLQTLYPPPIGVSEAGLWDTAHKGVYRVQSYYKGFEDIYGNLIRVDMMEGLVIKRRAAKLEPPLRERNNIGWQVKVRKPTKNYHF